MRQIILSPMIAFAFALSLAGCQSSAQWNPVRGSWQQEQGRLQLSSPSDEWSLTVRDGLQGNLTVESELTWQPDGESAQVGLVFGYKDAKNFGLCVLSQAPFLAQHSGQKEILQTIAFYQVINDQEELANSSPWIGASTGKQRLKVVTAGPQALAYINDKPILQWTFPSLQQGKAGVAARHCAATFNQVNVRPTEAGTQLYGTFNVQHDSAGAIVPRWPFKEIVQRSIDFTLWAADNGIGNWIRDEEGKRWPCYVYHATIKLDGSMDFFTNFPPEQFTPYMNGFLDYYQFSGDRRSLGRATELAQWLMAPAHNTPGHWPYGNLAFTTIVDGKMGGLMERDLISVEEQGYMASCILRLYHLTGKPSYLQYATKIAQTLLKHQLTQGNWFYRVNPKTGAPNKDFTANVVDNIIFFDEMHKITGNRVYRLASERAWRWILEGPAKQNRWLGMFGDVATNIGKVPGEEENYAPWVAQWAGRYLLAQRQAHPENVQRAIELREWINLRFLMKDAQGELGIAEQALHKYVMPSHGFRQALFEVDLYEATHKDTYKKMALHLLDSGMYQTEWNGLIRTYLFPLDSKSTHARGWGRNVTTETWWSNQLWAPTCYLYAMAAFPERAPAKENHLLRTSAPLTSIRYQSDRIDYGTARSSIDRLVVSSRPKAVQVGQAELAEVQQLGQQQGWIYDALRHVLEISHTATGEVSVIF